MLMSCTRLVGICVITVYQQPLYCHWRSGIKGATSLPSGVRWWMKKGWCWPLIRDSALCSLQCSNTDGWVAGRTLGAWKSRFTNPQKCCSETDGRGPERNRPTQVHLDKWPLNGSHSIAVCKQLQLMLPHLTGTENISRVVVCVAC